MSGSKVVTHNSKSDLPLVWEHMLSWINQDDVPKLAEIYFYEHGPFGFITSVKEIDLHHSTTVVVVTNFNIIPEFTYLGWIKSHGSVSTNTCGANCVKSLVSFLANLKFMRFLRKCWRKEKKNILRKLFYIKRITLQISFQFEAIVTSMWKN